MTLVRYSRLFNLCDQQIYTKVRIRRRPTSDLGDDPPLAAACAATGVACSLVAVTSSWPMDLPSSLDSGMASGVGVLRTRFARVASISVICQAQQAFAVHVSGGRRGGGGVRGEGTHRLVNAPDHLLACLLGGGLRRDDHRQGCAARRIPAEVIVDLDNLPVTAASPVSRGGTQGSGTGTGTHHSISGVDAGLEGGLPSLVLARPGAHLSHQPHTRRLS
jgi:hypothetical protein